MPNQGAGQNEFPHDRLFSTGTACIDQKYLKERTASPSLSMGDLTTGFDSSFSSPSPPVGKFGSFGAPPQKEQGRILDTDIESGTVSLFMSQTLSSCPSLFGTQKPNDRKPFGTNWSGARPRSPGPRYHVKPGLVLTQQREPTPKFGDHPRFERAGVRFYNEACSKQTNYGIDSPGAIYKIQTDFSPLNLPPGNSATIARRQVSPLRRSARAKFEGAEGGTSLHIYTCKHNVKNRFQQKTNEQAVSLCVVS